MKNSWKDTWEDAEVLSAEVKESGKELSISFKGRDWRMTLQTTARRWANYQVNERILLKEVQRLNESLNHMYNENSELSSELKTLKEKK